MRLVIALTALNLALLGFTVSAQNRSAALRASAFERVDEWLGSDAGGRDGAARRAHGRAQGRDARHHHQVKFS